MKKSIFATMFGALILLALSLPGTAWGADLSSAVGSYQDVRATAGLVYGVDGSTAPTYLVIVGGVDGNSKAQFFKANTDGSLVVDPSTSTPVYPSPNTATADGAIVGHAMRMIGYELVRIESASNVRVDIYDNTEASGTIISSLAVDPDGPAVDRIWYPNPVSHVNGSYAKFVFGSGGALLRGYYTD